eukprot:TRINITY_DN4431_c0_g1_i11.p2 TRINITY_DN4431_c0_g1~~TRINITY_DN4431_c0_g1_i11.p2  ORF type:complete len:191 (+),score=39.40 TRINITY_DN4431_c0_g1_i11:74-574(+)
MCIRDRYQRRVHGERKEYFLSKKRRQQQDRDIMGGVQRRKGNVAKNKKYHKKKRTRNYVRDVDQIYEDVKPENVGKFVNPEVNEDLPGYGQFYCITCSRHFVDKKAMTVHEGTKFHKRQLKKLKEKPYTQKDAEEYGKYQTIDFRYLQMFDGDQFVFSTSIIFEQS